MFSKTSVLLAMPVLRRAKSAALLAGPAEPGGGDDDRGEMGATTAAAGLEEASLSSGRAGGAGRSRC